MYVKRVAEVYKSYLALEVGCCHMYDVEVQIFVVTVSFAFRDHLSPLALNLMASLLAHMSWMNV